MVLEKILALTFISRYTKDNIKKLKETLLSAETIYRDEASEKISRMLLKDVSYAASVFKELRANGSYKELGKIWQALLNPDVEALFGDPEYPLLLKENLSPGNIKKHMQKKLTEENSITKFLNIYLLECYFIPVGGPLSPGKFIEEYFINKTKEEKRNRGREGFPEEEKKKWKETLYKDTFYDLKKWSGQADAPLAYLAVLEMVLYIRAISAEFDLIDFKSDDFYRFIDKIMSALLIRDTDEAEKEEMERINNINYRWNMRCKLSRYYLMYFDLHQDKPVPDEEKVGMAWWAAKKVEDVVFDPGFDIRDQNVFYRDNEKNMFELVGYIDFIHMFKIRNKKVSVARYYTQYNNPDLISLTLSILLPAEEKMNAFQGLKKPNDALNYKFVNIIISAIPERSFNGEEQILSGDKGILNYLWEIPFNASAPKFIKEYYGDAFPYLGEYKVTLIDTVKETPEPGYLEKKLENMKDILQDRTGVLLFQTIKSLEVYALIHGDLPKETIIFKDNKEMLDIILSLKPPMNILCILIISLVLHRCIIINYREGIDIFENMIENIDLKKLFSKKENEEYIEEILLALAGIVLFGYDLPFFVSFLNERHSRKVLEALGRLKVQLEHFLPHIPSGYRENLRKILNTLSGVPGISPAGFE
jgi:hypothetical protein